MMHRRIAVSNTSMFYRLPLGMASLTTAAAESYFKVVTPKDLFSYYHCRHLFAPLGFSIFPYYILNKQKISNEYPDIYGGKKVYGEKKVPLCFLSIQQLFWILENPDLPQGLSPFTNLTSRQLTVITRRVNELFSLFDFYPSNLTLLSLAVHHFKDLLVHTPVDTAVQLSNELEDSLHLYPLMQRRHFVEFLTACSRYFQTELLSLINVLSASGCVGKFDKSDALTDTEKNDKKQGFLITNLLAPTLWRGFLGDQLREHWCRGDSELWGVVKSLPEPKISLMRPHSLTNSILGKRKGINSESSSYTTTIPTFSDVFLSSDIIGPRDMVESSGIVESSDMIGPSGMGPNSSSIFSTLQALMMALSRQGSAN